MPAKRGSRKGSRKASPAKRYCSVGKRGCRKTSNKASRSPACRMTRSMRKVRGQDKKRASRSCRKVDSMSATRYAAMRRAEAAMPRRSRKQAGGAEKKERSNCAGRMKDHCVSPCTWRTGSKRQYCAKGSATKVRSDCYGRDSRMCGSMPGCRWAPERTNKNGRVVKAHCARRRSGDKHEGPMLPQDY